MKTVKLIVLYALIAIPAAALAGQGGLLSGGPAPSQSFHSAQDAAKKVDSKQSTTVEMAKVKAIMAQAKHEEQGKAAPTAATAKHTAAKRSSCIS